jgi:hypothetical protein
MNERLRDTTRIRKVNEMTTYRVTYEIDVDADSPYLAARQVDAIMHDPNAYPAMLVVKDPAGKVSYIDLAEEDNLAILRKSTQND